ncbi:hypothetical protein L210DRAFT_3615831 [Boletus edulis BED1]|uniref:Uncharacterized protein n=1 Tax=Boletus edulis BED1 TaxID=1328754 RepID=A0AAD4BCM3_BOLED|nr:hypothetical protein L210DRAFT_3615831 [Boletus edulis BED1]
MLLTNGLAMMCKLEDRNLETFSDYERKEYSVFCELLKLVPSLKSQLSSSDEGDVVAIAELIQRGANGARADDTKGMKCAILRVTGDQWPIILYANYMYDAKDPWNGLLHSGILISAYKYIFTSPSSGDLKELKATHSCNARIHALIAYVAIQAHFSLTLAQVFPHTDLLTDLERFYNSILKLLDDLDERDEVNQLLQWWNR